MQFILLFSFITTMHILYARQLFLVTDMKISLIFKIINIKIILCISDEIITRYFIFALLSKIHIFINFQNEVSKFQITTIIISNFLNIQII